MKKKTSRLLAVVLAFIMVLSSASLTFAATGFKQADGKIITSSVENNIAPGIDEEFVTTADSDGTNQNKTYICTVDPSVTTIGILASYRNYNSSGSWGMQTVRDQATAAERATGKKIVFAMNADYYNMNNGQPLGALVMNGKVVHETSGEPYFAILKNGQAVIRDANVSLDDVQEAVGSPFYLVRDGQVTPNAVDSYMMPRAAVGIKSTGELVFLVNDGRQAPYSCGMGTKELAESLVKSGCVTALYLDGGGSATFLSRSEGESELTLKNKPSDGVERAVSSAILIYSDAKSDGKLARVSISPKEEVYTPGSTIEFKAKGIDSTGERTDLPSDGKFTLKDTSYGSIDSNNGRFVSSGKEGTVTVQYESVGKVYGSANIEIRKPDSISFANSEAALAFGEESTLGLDVKWHNRDVNYKVGDFNWNISNSKMGAMNGNTFIASDSETVNGEVTCTYKGTNVSGKIAVIVGKEPTVVMDFEDYTDESGEVTLAKDYWTIGRATFTPNGGLITSYLDSKGNQIGNPNTRLLVGSYKDDGSSYVNRGSQESANIANLSDGDPVRKGAHSLQINYDFTNNNNSPDENSKTIDGACVGFSEQSSEIPGSPTGIGMYVYAPEGTLNLWLRIRVRDGSGTVQTVNFVADKESDPDGQKGINWTGWKYVEADLSKYSGPYQLIGGESIRPMYHLGGGYGDKDTEGNYVPKSQRKGSIYVDNLQFVYGTNTEDVDAPVINSVLANSSELTDGSVVESNTVNFIASTEDVENRYTSGIDSSSANVFLDGVNISKDGANFVDNEFRVTGLKVPDGEHTIQFLIRDTNGNETTKSIDFTVDYKPVSEVDGSLNLPKINVTDDGAAYLGQAGNINLIASDATNMSSVTSTIKLGSGYRDYEVEYADGFKEVEPPKYNKKDNSVTINAIKKEGANVAKNAPIAKLKVKIPVDSDANNSLTYKITSGSYKVKDSEGIDRTLTFSTKARKIALKAKYKLDIATLIEGFDAKIIVRDESGEAIKGVAVYGKGKNQSDYEKLGTTDANGELSTSKYREPQTVSFYAADKDDNRSFIQADMTYEAKGNEDGSPSNIGVYAAPDASDGKIITWISKPGSAKDKSILYLATKSAYDKKGKSAYKKYEGSVKTTEFSSEAVYVSTVKLSDLKPDTDYVYYVGDGQHWSEEKSFRTLFAGQDTNLLIVGDTQATSSEGIEQLNEVLASASKDHTFDLFVQTGDAIEKADSYGNWSNALAAFDNEHLDGVDNLRVIGNHETFGDDDALIARTIEGIKNYDHYSVNYGNIHIAVIGYTESEEQWKENADWIIADAKKNASKAKWKILLMHQPPYGTNLNDKIEARVNKYIPNACDEAGIDFVFSGHDHSYARTEPMKNGEVDENGTVYFIMGSTGEKSYSVNNNKDYHFVKATNDFSGLYTTIEASNTQFKVTSYEKDGTEFDSYIKTDETTCKSSKHSYLAVDNKHLLCRKCNTSVSIAGYTGLVRDYDSGIARYLLNGKYVTDGWRAVGDDHYYFGKDGFAVTKTKVIDGKEYTFDKTGKFLKGSFVQESVSDGKKTRTITRYYTAGGTYAIHWLDIDGKTYYFRKTSNATTAFDGEMYTGDGVTPIFVRTVGDNQNRYYTFNADGSLAVGAFDPEEVNGKTQYRYYWGDTYVTDNTMTIDGVEYTFDADGYTPEKSLNDCNISLPEVNVPYTGKEVQPAVEVFYKGASLKSAAHYSTKYSNNVKIGPASVTVSGNPYRAFTGTKTLSFAVVNPLTKNANPLSLTSKSRKITIGWNKVTQGTGYVIYYSTKSSGSSFKTLATIKNNKTVRYTTKKLKKNKTYYFYVRTYKTIDGKTYYGPKTTVKKVKVK